MAEVNFGLQEEAHDKRRTLMARSKPGRTGVALSASDVPPQTMPPSSMLRDDLELPEVTEGEVVRYFTYLSQLNFSVDTNFYPLGSCTMKYNPRINEAVAALPGFAMAHPLHQKARCRARSKRSSPCRSACVKLRGWPPLASRRWQEHMVNWLGF